MSKLTYDEVKSFIIDNSKVELLSTEFKNSKTKMKFRCECGNIFETNFDMFKRKNKRQCNDCGKRNQISKQVKTHKTFCEEVEKYGNEEYEVVGNYINNCTKIEILHSKCGTVYEVTPRKFISGRRCPKCNKNIKYTTNEIKEKINKLTNGEYELISEYVNYDTHISVKHKECGNIWEVLPHNFFKKRGTRCPKCCGREYWNTLSFANYVKETTSGEYEVVGKYINARQKIKVLHKKCGTIYEVFPYSFVAGNRCPNCKISHGEQKIKEYLIKNNIEFEREVSFPECKYYKPLKFDFKIRNRGQEILIEFDGIQHFQPVEIFGGEESFLLSKKRDNIKNKFCEDNKIKLVRISYKEEEKIEEILSKEIKKLIPR